MFILTIFEAIGTVAFAISGALVGIGKGLDIFGICILGITTALGGGMLRDVMLGCTPPKAMMDPTYMLVAIITSIITYCFHKEIKRIKRLILISDTIGLAVFAAIGSNAAVNAGFTEPFIVVIMGTFTGVGGGAIRDLFVNRIPMIFRQEIYAVACVLGAIAFYLSYGHVTMEESLYICFFVTLIVRAVALKKNINLPSKKELMINNAA